MLKAWIWDSKGSESLDTADRLAHLVNTWEVLTKGPLVLNVRKGTKYHS